MFSCVARRLLSLVDNFDVKSLALMTDRQTDTSLHSVNEGMIFVRLFRLCEIINKTQMPSLKLISWIQAGFLDIVSLNTLTLHQLRALTFISGVKRFPLFEFVNKKVVCLRKSTTIYESRYIFYLKARLCHIRRAWLGNKCHKHQCYSRLYSAV